ncbi:MAG: putative sugar O-methyltransferase [Anaerolineae bacterium]
MSVSDQAIFSTFCLRAAKEEAAFDNFKRDPFFNLLHEAYTFEEGKEFLNVIFSRTGSDFAEKWQRFKENDRFGNPRTFDYEIAGAFSPSTLLYVKIAQEIVEEFGSLEGLRIVQIGGGYGGLCKVLSDLFSFQSYTIIDLPASLELSKTYLAKLEVPNIHFSDVRDVSEEKRYDLVISHYAFSEFDGSLQKKLLSTILCKAKNGYIACTFYPKHFKIRPFSKEQLLTRCAKLGLGFKILKEEPLMGKDNFILLWKQEKASKT